MNLPDYTVCVPVARRIIAALLEQEAAMTPGPWFTWSNGFDGFICAGDPENVSLYTDGIFGGEPSEGFIDPASPNALGACAARNCHHALLLIADEQLEQLLGYWEATQAPGSDYYGGLLTTALTRLAAAPGFEELAAMMEARDE